MLSVHFAGSTTDLLSELWHVYPSTPSKLYRSMRIWPGLPAHFVPSVPEIDTYPGHLSSSSLIWRYELWVTRNEWLPPCLPLGTSSTAGNILHFLFDSRPQSFGGAHKNSFALDHTIFIDDGFLVLGDNQQL